jgi:hypothetical protein
MVFLMLHTIFLKKIFLKEMKDYGTKIKEEEKRKIKKRL